MLIQEVKHNMNRPVRYPVGRDLITYTLTGCILRIHNGKFYYQAELMDQNEKSVIIVPLERVIGIC